MQDRPHLIESQGQLEVVEVVEMGAVVEMEMEAVEVMGVVAKEEVVMGVVAKEEVVMVVVVAVEKVVEEGKWVQEEEEDIQE